MRLTGKLTGSIHFLQAVLICLALKKDNIISRKSNTYLLGFIEIDMKVYSFSDPRRENISSLDRIRVEQLE